MKNLKIFHFGIHNSVNGNLGDNVHLFLLRRWFDQFFYPTKLSWKLKQIWERNSLTVTRKINWYCAVTVETRTLKRMKQISYCYFKCIFRRIRFQPFFHSKM